MHPDSHTNGLSWLLLIIGLGSMVGTAVWYPNVQAPLWVLVGLVWWTMLLGLWMGSEQH